jgi:hypothetical protein
MNFKLRARKAFQVVERDESSYLLGINYQSGSFAVKNESEIVLQLN